MDIDEYVNIHAGDRTLPALWAALPEATAIPLTWRLFGNAGVVGYEDRPLREVFVRAAPSVLHWPWRAMLFKTLFRNDGTYGKLGVHRPRAPDPARVAGARWFDGSGAELPEAFRTGRIFSDLGVDHYGLVQLNHYALGSMEAFLVKSDRGRANRDASTADVGTGWSATLPPVRTAASWGWTARGGGRSWRRMRNWRRCMRGRWPGGRSGSGG